MRQHHRLSTDYSFKQNRQRYSVEPGMQPSETQRTIRSFVLRQGRLTAAQQHALDSLLPKYSLDSAGGLLDLAVVFGRLARCTLEIGFGNGDALAQLARQHPHEDFLGIEVHRPGVGRLLMTLEHENISNVRVLCADAVDVLTRCIPDESLDVLLVYFPDPWPKKRHRKRRLVQPEFVTLMVRKLKTGGQLQLATDWSEYATQMLDVLSANPHLANVGNGGGYSQRPATRPLTKFERRGIDLGHPVRDLSFIKR
jgi:tRNA (guanine-N7-)-methyltransferase